MFIKLGTLRAPSIGHLIQNSIRFFENHKNSPHSIVIVVNIKENITNTAVYELIKKQYQSNTIYFSYNVVLFRIYRLLFKLSTKIKYLKNFIADIEWIHHNVGFEAAFGAKYSFYDSQSFQSRGLFDVPSYYVEEFNQWRKVNRVDGKFVCMITRDSKYYDEHYHCYRNSNFNNYNRIINILIHKGWWVVRMGRNHAKDYHNDSDRYIDYQYSKNMSHVNETILMRECEFIVGTNTGFLNMQNLFDTRFLLIDHFPIGMCPPFKNCMYIPKKYLRHGKIIPYYDIPRNLLLTEDSDVLRENGISVRDNNEEEIGQFVVDHIDGDLGKGIDPKQFEFVVTGSGAKLYSKWYKDNVELFENSNSRDYT